MTNRLIGLCGKKRSGKDTAAWPLIEQGFKQIRFADPLKAMIRAFLRSASIYDEMIERYVEGDLKEVPLEVFEGRSTRYAVQQLGTEWGRGSIGESLWVNTFKRRASVHDLVVCTDIRFANEVVAIKSMGGKVIGIQRPNIQTMDHHESEAGIDNLYVDHMIYNDGSIAELHAQVRRAVLRD